MPRRPRRATEEASAPAPRPELGGFRLGVVPGATPGRWVDIWRDRHPRAPFELVPIDARDARTALDDGEADAAVVRLPIDGDGLSIIPLYEERSVAVFPLDSHLAAADELDLADLAGETVLIPEDDVMGAVILGADAPGFDPPASTREAIEVVAAGIGVVIVPMSIARVHRRRDVDERLLRDGPVSEVALVWPAARTTAEVEEFVGIVRGRTVNSSR